MGAFDVKQLSDKDAFRLDQAKKEETISLPTYDPGGVPAPFDPTTSAVAEVVGEIMAHWAEADEGFARDVAEESGDPNMKRIVGKVQGADPRPTEGMAGDFKADSEGPTEGIEVPPRADGGEFGGGGNGDAGGPGQPSWSAQADGDMGDMADPGGDLPGFSVEGTGDPVHGGGGGGGGTGGTGDDDDDPISPPKPPDPKKPKKP
jgi:hypothetical protein